MDRRAGGDKVNFQGGTFRLSNRMMFRAANIPAAVTIVIILCAAVFAEFQNRELFRQQLRADATAELARTRGRLEGNLDRSIQLVRGLVATLSIEPEMTQERFSALASNVLREAVQIRHISAAPDLVVTLIHPVEGNEKALGLDYRQNEGQRGQALQVRDSGKLVLAGPVELVQGGTALIGRFPVLVGEEGRFWGIVSAVIDMERLYAASGLLDASLPIDIAIGRGNVAEQVPFFGPGKVLVNEPVMANIELPSSSLFIAAAPKGGWDVAPDNRWLLRGLIALCGALIVTPMLITGRLVGERQNHIEELRRAKNLTEARNAELLVAKARIEHTALHDSLTGLPNRRYLDKKLELRASSGNRTLKKTALLHIDLDRFKQINDTLGHAAGDAMLIHAANILKANVRAGDFLARVGGDEFVVLCKLEGREGGDHAKYLAALAERIIGKMREPVIYEGHECRFGVSVGIAMDEEPGDDLRDLLVNADIALYRAKSQGRNRHQFFNETLQAEIVSTKRIADEILTGLEQGQFIVHYQPQFDASTLEVMGVEALVRWNHPTRGILGPDAFLKVAEELSVVSTLDRVVLEQALADFEDWRNAGLVVPKVAVNVSARRLNDEELIASLRGLGIRPGTVSFELVESIFLDDNDAFIASNVERIKDLGIDVEIDDFGTGYASIVSLLKLKPRRLKIDRQLIMPIAASPGQCGLVESIIDIGRSLGIEVIAEGVETMEHARILKKLGCRGLQGYVFARPMGSEALKAFVRNQAWRSAS